MGCDGCIVHVCMLALREDHLNVDTVGDCNLPRRAKASVGGKSVKCFVPRTTVYMFS